MFLCTLCGKKSRRGEIPLSILHEARRLSTAHGSAAGFLKGWEIAREGFAALSHRHKPKYNQEFKRWTPWVGFKVS